MRIVTVVILAISGTLTFALFAMRTFDSTTTLTGSTEIDSLIVHKHARKLIVYSKGMPLKTFAVSVGRGGSGPKRKQGDEKTPEGEYLIDAHMPQSSFYKSLHVSYPNAEDRKIARRNGDNPGGDICIHGMPNGRSWFGLFHRLFGSTEGCVMVTDREMDELYTSVKDGTRIRIGP